MLREAVLCLSDGAGLGSLFAFVLLEVFRVLSCDLGCFNFVGYLVWLLVFDEFGVCMLCVHIVNIAYLGLLLLSVN